MGSYFAIRDITAQKDIWDTSSSFYKAVELFMRGIEADFARGIFYEAPVIGFNSSGYDRPENELPPAEGISGSEAAQEMALILGRIDASTTSPNSDNRVSSSRTLFEDLQRQFASAPDHQFRGYIQL